MSMNTNKKMPVKKRKAGGPGWSDERMGSIMLVSTAAHDVRQYDVYGNFSPWYALGFPVQGELQGKARESISP